MELRHIRYFIAVAESKSLTAATTRLHVAQPALSQNIKALEAELGVELFMRSRLGVALTDAGADFLSHAYEVIRQVDRARESVKPIQGEVYGSVKIALPASVCNVLAVPVQSAVFEEYPLIDLTMEEGLSGTLAAAFGQGLFDVLIDFDVDGSSEIRIEPLIREELFFISSKRDTGTLNEDIEFKKLGDYQIILPAKFHGMSRAVDKYAEDANVSLHRGLRAGSMHTAIKLVQAGLGTAILPWTAIFDSTNTNLTTQRITNPTIYRTVQMITSASRPRTSAMLVVMDIIRRAVSEAHRANTWRGELLFDIESLPNVESDPNSVGVGRLSKAAT